MFSSRTVLDGPPQPVFDVLLRHVVSINVQEFCLGVDVVADLHARMLEASAARANESNPIHLRMRAHTTQRDVSRCIVAWGIRTAI